MEAGRVWRREECVEAGGMKGGSEMRVVRRGEDGKVEY